MASGNKHLDSVEYEDYLVTRAKKGGYYSKNAERELRQRNADKRNANKGIEGWHFGIDYKPVYTKNKEEFRRELDKRNLMMRDDVKKDLRK